MRDDATGLPLEGIVVLDLSRLLPGGFCSLLLADHGADVVKVEDTGAGDYARWLPPVADAGPADTASLGFVGLNRNKYAVSLDLKHPDGRDAFLRLAARADVVLESFRPGVMDRLGLGYDVLAAENPRLVYCAISGYGQTGTLAQRAGHDLDYLAATGVLALTGEAGGPPVQPGVQVADIGGGALAAAFAILAALRERDRSGRGQLLDVSMAHGALSWLTAVAPGVLAGGAARRDTGMLDGGALCYRPYACADGFVALGALEPKFWEAWCRGVGRPDLVEHQFDPPGSPAHAEVEAVFAARTRDEWERFAAEHDCCLEPVREVAEALASPLVAERGIVVEVEQPGHAAPVRTLGAAVGFSRTPADALRLPAPRLGEHTVEVLTAAGYTREEVARLLESGAARAAGGDPS